MNQPISFELAKLLKEKGFDRQTKTYYEYELTSKKDPESNNHTGVFGWKQGETNLQSGYFINNYELTDLSNTNWFMCAAPTITDVVMWLLEEHKLLVYVDLPWHFRIRYLDSDSRFFDIDREDGIELIPTGLLFSHTKIFKFTSIHEAYEAGINYCLIKLI